MRREIKKCQVTLSESIALSADTNLEEWLVRNAPETAVTLLAFDLEGLIWGKLESGAIVLATENSIPLRVSTLQEARLFGETAELHIWRTGDELKAQILTETTKGEDAEYFDESQILWGDQVEPITESGFTLMSDGVQGLHHAVPLNVPKPTKVQARESNLEQYKERPLRLIVRHYLAKKPFARIEFSRLVSLHIKHKDHNQNEE